MLNCPLSDRRPTAGVWGGVCGVKGASERNGASRIGSGSCYGAVGRVRKSKCVNEGE